MILTKLTSRDRTTRTSVPGTCQAFRHALRQNTGFRIVYLHFRQTQAALPKVYGVVFDKICTTLIMK